MFEIDYPHQLEDQSQIDSLKTNSRETDSIRESGPSPINWPINLPLGSSGQSNRMAALHGHYTAEGLGGFRAY